MSARPGKRREEMKGERREGRKQERREDGRGDVFSSCVRSSLLAFCRVLSRRVRVVSSSLPVSRPLLSSFLASCRGHVIQYIMSWREGERREEGRGDMFGSASPRPVMSVPSLFISFQVFSSLFIFSSTLFMFSPLASCQVPSRRFRVVSCQITSFLLMSR